MDYAITGNTVFTYMTKADIAALGNIVGTTIGFVYGFFKGLF